MYCDSQNPTNAVGGSFILGLQLVLCGSAFSSFARPSRREGRANEETRGCRWPSYL